MLRNVVALSAGVLSAASLAAMEIAPPATDPTAGESAAMAQATMEPDSPTVPSDELLRDDPPAAGAATFIVQGRAFSVQACAKEGGSCMLLTPTAIAYGAAGGFAVRTFAAGTVACNNLTFGDPKFGVVKGCFVATASTASTGAVTTTSAVPPGGFQPTACAREGGSCTVTSPTQVAYGAAGGFAVKTFNAGTVGCSNATFGDPKVGVLKACYLGPAGMVQTPAPPPPTAPPLTPPFTGSATVTITPALADASRFLVQATYGPNLAEIDALSKSSPSQWMERQFATPPMDTHWAYVMERKGPIGCNPCDAEWINAVMESFWLQAVRGPDQLRQRLVFALSQLFVVSTVNSPVEIQKDAHASYLDMLSRNAFGNYRTLLEEVSTHPTMAAYLSSLKNDKEDPATGRLPDENYAREVMQLFTIGLWQLNPDGTRKKDSSGNDIPTYTQSDVMGMAKVFTGWAWGGKGTTEGDWNGWTGNGGSWDKRLINYPQHHSLSEKRIVGGVVIAANTPGPQSLKIALDTLFNHPNMGPMFGTHLIKRFVTSNPSPAYVARVTAAFNNNGQGVRGDMKAVIRAVLLDPEARDVAKANDPNWGKLREPMIRYANFMRAFNVQAPSGKYKIWNLENPVSSIGQNPLRAPSVFNWYTENYAPPGEILAKGMVAPEFAITHETTTTGYTNFMVGTAERQSAWWRENAAKKWGPITDYLGADYAAEMSLASNPSALVDRLNLILAQGRMSAATKKTIVDALNTIPASTDSGHRRVAAAVALTLVSPDFIVQK
jgi:uncharacterized protein (DUF1800 family)